MFNVIQLFFRESQIIAIFQIFSSHRLNPTDQRLLIPIHTNQSFIFGNCRNQFIVESIEDEGVLEKFDVSLEEAQTLIMTARVMLGWVDPTELEAAPAEDGEDAADDEEAEA